MRIMRSSIWVVGLFLILLPTHARADVLYTFTFDPLEIHGFTFPADSFSFSVPNIIDSGQTVPMPPGTELNDYYFASLAVTPKPGSLEFGGSDLISYGQGDLGVLYFTPDSFPGGVGIYPSANQAVRIRQVPMVGLGFRNSYWGSGSGTLTITGPAAPPIPEPASLLLLGTGLGVIGLAAWRRGR